MNSCIKCSFWNVRGKDIISKCFLAWGDKLFEDKENPIKLKSIKNSTKINACEDYKPEGK